MLLVGIWLSLILTGIPTGKDFWQVIIHLVKDGDHAKGQEEYLYYTSPVAPSTKTTSYQWFSLDVILHQCIANLLQGVWEGSV